MFSACRIRLGFVFVMENSGLIKLGFEFKMFRFAEFCAELNELGLAKGKLVDVELVDFKFVDFNIVDSKFVDPTLVGAQHKFDARILGLVEASVSDSTSTISDSPVFSGCVGSNPDIFEK